MEFFDIAIMLVGIGVLFRVFNLRAALMTIGLVCLGAALLPSAGRFTENVPLWVFWGVLIILSVNLLRTVLGGCLEDRRLITLPVICCQQFYNL